LARCAEHFIRSNPSHRRADAPGLQRVLAQARATTINACDVARPRMKRWRGIASAEPGRTRLGLCVRSTTMYTHIENLRPSTNLASLPARLRGSQESTAKGAELRSAAMTDATTRNTHAALVGPLPAWPSSVAGWVLTAVKVALPFAVAAAAALLR
jgi:hypothetical protein